MSNQPLINRYSSLASKVYHLDKPIGKSFGDIEFYTEKLKNCQGKILEPATGNGRVLIPLAEKGYDISGFDASAEMLHYCQMEIEKRGLSIKVTQESFENFDTSTRYDAIILPAGSFQLITNTDIAISILKRFKEALNPKGKLLIDLSPLSALNEPPMMARSWSTNSGLLTLTEAKVESNYITQTTVSQLRYEQWSNEGILQCSELDFFALRFWGVKEFELALQVAGFKDIQIFSNYTVDQAIDTQTHTLTFEAV